jgi:membrane-associated phospholipid phosphatase
MSSPPIDADAPTDTVPDTRSRELLAPAGTQEVHENETREAVGGRVLWGMDERTWRRIRFVLIGLYGAAYVWWFIERGIIIDRISVLLSVVLFLIVATIGRPWQDWLRLARDAGLFVLMWVAYDESRGIADRLGMPIQVESVRNIDRVIFFGHDPTVWLQYHFYEGPNSVRWYDVVGSVVYYSHFIVPPVVIATLYVVNRHQWSRYMRRFATVLFVACTMFILLPTAPPWMAAGGKNGEGLHLDALPPLRRPTGNGWRHIGLGAFVKAWDTGRDWANQIAAMPSLHCAFALFVVVFCFKWVKNWWLRALMLLYPLMMVTALMYFGEHYFADGLAGFAVVGLSFLLWNRIERYWDRRRANAAPVDSEQTDSEQTGSEQAGVRPTVDV